MKKSIRFISLILALLLMAASFVACNKGADDPAATTTASSDGAQSEPTVDFVLKSASGTACKICYPDSFDGTPFYSTLSAMIATIDSKIGAKSTVIKASEYVDDGTPTIFVGDTGTAASSAFMADLLYSDYGFKAEGNDIYLGAHSQKSFSKATSAFNEVVRALSATDGAFIIPATTAVLERGSYTPATVNGVPLNSFTIVYESEALTKAVDNAVNAIGTKTGAPLKAALASEATESEYEIIIGNVGREISNTYYAASGNFSEYEILVSGKTIAVLARDPLALECGAKGLAGVIESEIKDGKIALEDGSYKGSFYESAKLGLEARPEGTDIRIGGNNVYFHQNGDIQKIDYRNPILLESIKYMDADIVLLQEVSPKWHSVMDSPMQTELGYTLVPTSTEITPVLDGRANYTPIWYRAEKLELLDYGYKQYETVKLEPDSYLSSSKSYTWALFKDKATGKQIITVTTHFTWAPENFNPTPDQCRTMDAKEVVELVKQLEVEYAGVPIILMGDLNCTVSSNPYNVLMEKFDNVKNVDEKENGTSKGTTHSVGSSTVGGSIIDHTLYTGDALNFKMYQHVYNEWSFNSTDHIPLLLDVQFK